MSVNTETGSAQGQTTVLEKEGVYASLFEKINLTPASSLGDINAFLDDAALADAPAGERLTAAMQVFMDCIRKSGQQVEKLDKTLIDHHIAELDFQISRQLDAVMHHEEFQKVESLWRGLKQLVDNTDYRQNVKTEILDVSKDDLRQDFEDAPELIQSGLYWHTYTAEYDTVPVRSFNYVEQVKGPDHEKYLWTSASFAFASNMVKSFINNGWCVQIRGPQAGGAVKDLPIHLYDLGTGNQVKIPSEVMIPETREFEFANLGFIPLTVCFFAERL